MGILKIEKALELLKNNQVGNFTTNEETMVITKNAIVIRFYKRGEISQAVLAAKIGSRIIGNSSGLRDLNHHRNNAGLSATEEQLNLATKLTMIPFDVMKQAGLDLNKYSELEAGPEETIYLGMTAYRVSEAKYKSLQDLTNIKDLKIESEEKGYSGAKEFTLSYKRGQHFAGARLFKVDTKVFLLDVDRVELSHGIVNPFLVELKDNTVKTIKDAYQSLKPIEVLEAESRGTEVLRQGEWFLIALDELTQRAVNRSYSAKVNEEIANGIDKHWAGRGELRAGNNRPNRVAMMTEIDGKFFVSGEISHSGREHKTIKLKDFYQAVPNTSQTSWQITGDLD